MVASVCCSLKKILWYEEWTSDIRNILDKASAQLDEIWNETSYSNKAVRSQSIKYNDLETPLSDYQEVRDALDKLEKSKFYAKHKGEIKFLLRPKILLHPHQ